MNTPQNQFFLKVKRKKMFAYLAISNQEYDSDREVVGYGC